MKRHCRRGETPIPGMDMGEHNPMVLLGMFDGRPESLVNSGCYDAGGLEGCRDGAYHSMSGSDQWKVMKLSKKRLG